MGFWVLDFFCPGAAGLARSSGGLGEKDEYCMTRIACPPPSPTPESVFPQTASRVDHVVASPDPAAVRPRSAGHPAPRQLSGPADRFHRLLGIGQDRGHLIGNGTGRENR